MSLYKTITRLPLTQDWSARFKELGLIEGWEMLSEFKNEERKKVALFCIYAYDPDSKKIKNYSDRIKDKSDIARSLELEPLTADGLVSNDFEAANRFVTWYSKQIKSVDKLLIDSGYELFYEQLEISRTKIKKTGMDEDKWLKAMQLKHDCFVNAIENRQRLERLEKEYDNKYKKMDDTIREEVEGEKLKNSGRAEKNAEKYKSDLE